MWDDGFDWIAGLDEVGRGAWAGPVVAAAVVLPRDNPLLSAKLAGVRDSKLLAPSVRERLLPRILHVSSGVGIGMSSARFVDRWGIVQGTRQAMAMAVRNLAVAPGFLLVDGLRLPNAKIPQLALNKGDAQVLSIASASIVAKVFRDRLMVDLDQYRPGYGFSAHKGYGTPEHRSALNRLGPCPVHRFSFAPLRRFADPGGAALK